MVMLGLLSLYDNRLLQGGQKKGLSGVEKPIRLSTGREWDKETGLYYYRARYYDPMEGRFISKDPSGLTGGINLYVYAKSNPVNYADPLGLRPLSDCEKKILGPYIPRIDLDNADLHPGEMPWYVSSNYDGITRGNDIYLRSYDPSNINDIATLGHELVHVGQYREGMTWASYIWSCRNGYYNSKYEIPAYAMGRRILADLQNSKNKECLCEK
jgi:RHS repeat-associated protein